MIHTIKIHNYKSVVDVNLSLDRFNLLIGANGCGKSNILEAIAFASAASTNKLDYEYFANRGIRVVEPRNMFSAFDGIAEDVIVISVIGEEDETSLFKVRYNDSAKPARWEDESIPMNLLISLVNTSDGNVPVEELIDALMKLNKDRRLNVKLDETEDGWTLSPTTPELSQFVIYSLEESKLRQADDSNRIFPLGRNGEGLFAYLKDLAQRPSGKAILEEIKENLRILDWFEDMSIPTDQLSKEFNIRLYDNYLSETIQYFDQRSTNEGFLFLLFYLTLIISDETPTFFAIENIDSAFNPKLCREIVKKLIELAGKHDKQIIATTHNPSVLDGLNLEEDDNLIVVRRTVDGHTKASKVNLKAPMSIPLSEAWTKGYLGGLPDNF